MTGQSGKSLAENETFIRLILVAQEDEEIRKQIRGLLVLPEFQRQSVLGSVIATMRLKNAPQDFISAIEALRDSDVVQRVRELIGENKDGQT